MERPMVNDLDYLAGRLHARRSRLAEADRLDALCGLHTVAELARAIYPDSEFQATAEFERRLVRDLVLELSSLLGHLDGAAGRLFASMLVRFQVENLKVLVRGVAAHSPFDGLREHLIALPRELTLDFAALATAESWEEFARRMPRGTLRKRMQAAVRAYGEQPRPFFLEAMLDCGYFEDLLGATDELTVGDQEVVRGLVSQEVDIFHLVLVARGKHVYHLATESLLPLHVRGSAMTRERFALLLADPDLLTVAGHAVGSVLDALPPDMVQPGQASGGVDPAVLEFLAWKRFLRLANRAFRRGQMGLGVVVGYAGLRRVEVANLITVCEGIRAGVAGDRIRARLIARDEKETAHVLS